MKEGEEPPTKTVPRTSNVWETINVAKPLWMRSPKEVTDDEYAEFYKTTFRAYDNPDAHVHFSLEGQAAPHSSPHSPFNISSPSMSLPHPHPKPRVLCSSG